jgi:hypothetical protein
MACGYLNTEDGTCRIGLPLMVLYRNLICRQNAGKCLIRRHHHLNLQPREASDAGSHESVSPL